MYLLTIKEGLHTRHVGPYASPKEAAEDLDRLLASCSDRAHWQIHALESPAGLQKQEGHPGGRGASAGVAGIAA
ncbi:hypothetical protein [Cyanobium sp. ATX 6F1]|uniref:hypothetical protein n=1 Tax=unclassified Cyanobium TaxID=2627006 RepID=UPI0020CC61D1|nr:hypothetical protein [Cyanobium sp. ATX 6F1]MCP9916912.1 hypothetical protein [Cyanobium sp. ATX 6F1]